MTRASNFPRALGDFNVRPLLLLRLCVLAIIIGASSTLIGYLLIGSIGLITNLVFFGEWQTELRSLAGHRLGYWVVLPPVIGGLVIGLVARYGSEKIRGHGIPEALEAILIGRSRMDPKVAVLKPISSAISIGSGGPFGAEGPIIMTGGAFGSLVAQCFSLSSAERKTLLVAGAAAGMSAIFNTPLAAVLIAVELLLFEWRPRSFIPVAFASITAALLRAPLFGVGPLFPIAAHSLPGTAEIVVGLFIGVVAGFGSGALTALVYVIEDLFEKLPIHWMWWPALGGVVVGLGGLVEPRALGVGYDLIEALLRGEMLGTALITVLVIKTLVWTVALGSGTSGGVLAPLLIIGGALGALTGQFFVAGDARLWAMVGMAAMMGGTMRSPFTAIIFALELTVDVAALPVLLVGTVSAVFVTVLLLKRSILTEKVARHGHHVQREYTVDPYEIISVAEVMDKDIRSVPDSLSLSELSAEISSASSPLRRHQGIPLVDEGGKLSGIITRGDVLRAIANNHYEESTVKEVGSTKTIVAYPDELLRDAAARMLRHNIGRLLVVDRSDPRLLLGYLGRGELMAARLGRTYEEDVREALLAFGSRR